MLTKRSLLVLLILLFINIGLVRFWHQAQDYPTGDGQRYFALSAGSSDMQARPFVYRRFSPWVVRELNTVDGWGLTFNWGLLTVLATTLTQWLFYLLLREGLNLSRFSSWLGVLLLASTYIYTSFNYQSIWLVDPLNNTITVLALWLLLTRRYGYFLLTAALGAFNKETILLLVPLYPLFELLRPHGHRARRVGIALLAMAAAFLPYVVYQHWLNGVLGLSGSGNPFAGSQSTVIANLQFIAGSGRPSLFSDGFNIFVFGWILLGYSWYLLVQQRGNLTRLGVLGVYWLGVLSLSTFIAADMSRVIGYAAPAVILTIVVLLDAVPVARRPYLALLLFVYVALNGNWLPDKNLAVILNVAVLAVALPWLSIPSPKTTCGRLISIE